MKSIFYKIIYSSQINAILRPIAYIVYMIFNKKIITISGILKIKAFGVKFKLKTNQTCSVTQELYFNGAENYEFSPLFKELILQSKVFFDVGANIGYFTVLAGKLNPKVSIYTFEPSFGPSHYVQENIALNNITNSTLIKKAVSDLDGKLLFHDVINTKYPWVVHNLNGSNSLQNKFGLNKSSSYEVDVITLDTIVKENKLSQLDVLKLDTECTEHLILKCSKETIRQLEPIIICEVYDVIAKETQQVLDDLDQYEIFQYRNHCLRKIHSLLDVSDDTVYRNFIFCPKTKITQIQMFIN
ncbi:MAG: FkbM family methyltransferase [Flavobacteriia bacterium]|nr:FkbM family methyltransferase [Flavobacteriia bacterium]